MDGVKERPILFSGPMVRAILEGRKTQTRRVSGLDVINKYPDRYAFIGTTSGPGSPHYAFRDKISGAQTLVKCGKGQPGDRLWVREAFIHEPADYCWEASVSVPVKPAYTIYLADCTGETRGAGWSPSIHMPRRLSRITLEITGVRVERLNDISESDALAEGINCYQFRPDDGFPICDGYTYKKDDGACILWPTAKQAFQELFESINGNGSWDADLFVWVIQFRRVP